MFGLDEKQAQTLLEWKKTLPEGHGGAIGGRFTYSFTPTSLGMIVKVSDAISKQEIDLSDYDEW